MNFVKEPVLISQLVQAVLVLAVVFGLALTGPQTAAIVVVTNILIAGFLRAKVTPAGTLEPETPSA